MGKKAKWGIILGIAAGAGAAYLAYRVNKEILAMPSETDSYKEKAMLWYEMKKESIKESIDAKREQVKEIARSTKEALIGENSAEKRKEIMDSASKKISAIGKEIQELISKGAKEVSAMAQKVSNSDLFADITQFFSSLKAENKDIVDVDYTFESDFENEAE